MSANLSEPLHAHPQERMPSFEIDDRFQGERAVPVLQPADGGSAAYKFLFASFLLEAFIWGYSYSFATTLVHLETHEPWKTANISALSAVGTTQLGLQFILPIALIFLFSRYPEYIQISLWCSVAASCLSTLIASWATQVWQLILLQGIICGTANAIIFTPVLLWLSQWWVQRRSTAFGVICSGIGIGGFGFPFLMNTILERGGFPWLCRAWALISAIVFSAATWMIKPRIPTYNSSMAERRTWISVDKSLFKNPIFLFMGLSTFLAGCSYLPVALYLPTYAASLTSSVTQQNLTLAIFNLIGAFGSILSGMIADRSYSMTVLICGLCGALLSLSAWGFADSLAKVYGFAVLFSLTGQMVSAWGGAAKEVAGANPNTASIVFCLFSSIRGVASIVIPFLTELLLNKSSSQQRANWGAFGFQNMIIFVGSTAFLASLGGAGMHFVLWRRR